MITIKINTKDINISQVARLFDGGYGICGYRFLMSGQFLQLVTPAIDVELLGFLKVNGIHFRLLGI